MRGSPQSPDDNDEDDEDEDEDDDNDEDDEVELISNLHKSELTNFIIIIINGGILSPAYSHHIHY